MGLKYSYWQPSVGLHVFTEQRLPSSQSISVPRQVPPVQTVFSVQALPSSHAAPSGLAGLEQVPVAGSHTPTSWHGSDAAQTVAVPPVQTPTWQVSPVVHRLLSLQAVPSALSGLEQTP